MKTYGESTYKAFLILKDKKGIKSKHYVCSVDPTFDKKSNSHVFVGVRMGANKGDEFLEYKLGSNKKADIAIKTWISERDKQNKHYSSNLPDACYDYLYKKHK